MQIVIDGAELIDNRWIKVSKTVTDRCIDELEHELVDNLPIVDFTKFSASIHRLYGRQWDGKFDHHQPLQCPRCTTNTLP